MNDLDKQRVDSYFTQNPKHGWVYILYDSLSKSCKIGSTKTKYLQRCNTQIAGSSTKLFFLCAFCIDNFRQTETHLHRHFKKNRFNGEWFKVSPMEILKYMDCLTISHKVSLFYSNSIQDFLIYQGGVMGADFEYKSKA